MNYEQTLELMGDINQRLYGINPFEIDPMEANQDEQMKHHEMPSDTEINEMAESMS